MSFYRSRIPQQTYNIPQMIPGGVTVTFQFSISRLAALPSNFSSLFAELPSYLYIEETPVTADPPEQLFSGQDPINPKFRAQVTATSP